MSVTTSFTITDSLDLANAIVAIDKTGTEAAPDTSYTFTFDLTGTNTLALNGALNAINLDTGSSLTIAGSGDTLSGSGPFGGLFVYGGTVTIQALTIADALAEGGQGGAGGGGTLGVGGGGGAGLGGGLFVASGASVTLDSVGFVADGALGGNGGNASGGGGPGGGGGMGGDGGSGYGDAGGGGGGIGANGGNAPSGGGGGGLIPGAERAGGGALAIGIPLFNGGASGGGGGAGGITGGGGGGGVGAGSATFGAGGGGFGGGGGGSAGAGIGGKGGFGGGGGASLLGSGGAGGAGGFGGGGGAGNFAGGAGGFGGGAGHKGGSGGGGGGGGLGAGGDIFVQQGGTLAILGGSLDAGAVSGGAGGKNLNGTRAGAGQGLGSAIFIQGNESITFAPTSGETLTISGGIADQTGSGGTGTNEGAGTLVIGSTAGGGGTVVLSAANTYTGQTVLESGTLELAAAGAAGSSAILFAGDPVLTVTNADLSGGGNTLSFANTIDTFNTASTIDLPGLSFDPHGTTTLETNSGSPSTLEVVAHGTTVDFSFASSIDFAGLHFHLTPDAGTGTLVTENTTPCFLRGTLILTPKGEVPVEMLKAGDLVRTAAGAARPLRWVGFGRTLVTPRNRDRATPVVVRRHALAENIPYRDLYVTRGHALYLEGVLIPVEELINHRSIAWVEEARVVEFYHLELDSHDVVIAERAAAESYREDDNSPLFQNVATRPAAPEMPPYAPVLHEHPTVKRIWKRLSDRAGRLELDFTDDPDLHLRADGVRLAPETVAERFCRFRLSGPVIDLRIVSRSAIPAMIGLDQDQRRLGVALRKIVLRQRGLTMELGWDEPRLQDGFHNAEPAQQHRWTDGEAALPRELLAPFGAGAEVELHVSGLLPYPRSPAAAGTALPRAA